MAEDKKPLWASCHQLRQYILPPQPGSQTRQLSHTIMANNPRQPPKPCGLACLNNCSLVVSSLWGPCELLAIWLLEWTTSVFPSTSSFLNFELLLPSHSSLYSSDLLPEWQMFLTAPFSSLQISRWGRRALHFYCLNNCFLPGSTLSAQISVLKQSLMLPDMSTASRISHVKVELYPCPPGQMEPVSELLSSSHLGKFIGSQPFEVFFHF